MKFSETRNFGFNIIIRKYANFSPWLPLPCHLEHGWTPLAEPLVTDLDTDKPLMLVYSKRRKEAWQKKSRIPVEIMGAPFIHYKNLYRITKKPDAQGTIVLPNHSMPNFEVKFDIKKYCRQLKALPKEFHPITICLFWFDYIDKSADIYRKEGFKVVTAGPKISNSLKFANNFYKILAAHKYATSNDVGSYTFYAIDLGLPFFILGEIPTIINIGGADKNVPESAKNDEYYWGKKAIELFSTKPTTKITPEQKKFVEEEMGLKDCLSTKKMNKLLYSYLKKNKQWRKTLLSFYVSSLLALMLFNTPLIRILWAIRHRFNKANNS